MSMLKNLCYTVPLIGRIAIGERVTRDDGTTLPSRLNHFLITAQHKHDGQWATHPAHKDVASATKQDVDAITEIPVRLMFNAPELNAGSRYEAWSPEKGRLLCAGDGCTAKRVGQDGKLTEIDCPGADYCEFGTKNRCRPMSRVLVQIDVGEDKPYLDVLSGFMLRSAGFNTARTIMSKLQMFQTLLGGKLRGVPFSLKLRKKSSPQSFHSAFYYVDLVLRQGVTLQEAAQLAKAEAQAQEGAGLQVDALEDLVRANLQNGGFAIDTSEDFEAVSEHYDFGVGDFETPTPPTASGAGVLPSPAVAAQNESPVPAEPAPINGFPKVSPAVAAALQRQAPKAAA